MTINIKKESDGGAWIEPFNLCIPSQAYTSIKSSLKSRRDWDHAIKTLLAQRLIMEIDSLENATIIVDGEEMV